MRLRIYCLLAVLWPVMTCYCQSPPNAIRPLTIGDTVPDITLTNVYNYPVSKIRLSDLKGKLVILDFWSSWCSSCFSFFPELDSLQEIFKDSLQIILVNTKSYISNDDEPKIKSVLDKVRKNAAIRLDMPVSYNNKIIDEYFPCVTIPHEVWIDKNGVVAGITSAKEVNAGNIRSLIRGEEVSMKLKNDMLDFDLAKPLFNDGNGGYGTETVYRSLFSTEIAGLAGVAGFRKDENGTTGFYAINQSLLSLIKTAYTKEIPYPDNRIILNNREKYNNIYSYDLVLPSSNSEKVFEYLKEDLNRYFNISLSKQKRIINCLVLKNKTSGKRENSSAKPEMDIEEYTKHKYIHNYPIKNIVRLLNRYSPVPIIDETNLTNNASINLPFSLSDTKGLQDAFQKSGLELSEAKRELEVVIISDR